MDNNGRPNHIEDYLIQVHTNQWFGWSNPRNKVYANLQLTSQYGVDGVLVDNPHSLPTEQECIDGLVAVQTAFDDAKTKKIADKASANSKLEELGLTADEITAITRG